MKLNITSKLLYGLACLLLATLSLTACQRGGSGDLTDIGMNLTVSPDPPAVGKATVILTLSDANGQPIAGAEVNLEANMSHAGMVPAFAQAAEAEPGRYEASLEFTMGGDWFILVKATLPDGQKMERQVDVPGVKTR